MINEILGLAVIDETFQRELLADPLGTIQKKNIVLTEREEEVLRSMHTADFAEFARILLERLAT